MALEVVEATPPPEIMGEPSPEDWAFARVQAGEIADFNERFGPLDPTKPDGWDGSRRLGADFLKRIFVDGALGEKLPPEGVRIIGAYLPDGMIFRRCRASVDVWLDKCRADQALNFRGATFEGWLSLEGSCVGYGSDGEAVDLAQVTCGNINLGGVVFEGKLSLNWATVGGVLEMSGSTFEQAVTASNLQVGQTLFMQKGATFRGELTLSGTKTGGQLDMSGSTFEQTVNADGIQIGQTFFMRDGATFRGVLTLNGAKIDGQFDMSGSTFEQTVSADSIQIGQTFFMRDGATFRGDLYLLFAKIGGDLDMRYAWLHGLLDLSGARVTQDLRMAAQGSEATWGQGSSIRLRNARAGTLQDSPSAWPLSSDLEGFAYDHLGGFGADGSNDARNRPVADWLGWLAKDGGAGRGFSPRPYTQLASVLAAAGRRDQANEILYAGRERERKAAWFGRKGRWLFLTVLSRLCGYGIGVYTFRVLGWILGSVALATFVLWWLAPLAWAKGWWWCGLASLDQLLPVVTLNKQFGDFFASKDSSLPAGVITFFAVLRIWGWVLGSFLIAAVSGLTQRS